MQALIEAISNPYRREILRLVWEDELPSGRIASQFPIRWQSVSRNLKVLRDAGLIEERQEGTRRLYRANREALRPLEALLRKMWDTSLDTMIALAEGENRRASI